jgi:hypothetical protein
MNDSAVCTRLGEGVSRVSVWLGSMNSTRAFREQTLCAYSSEPLTRDHLRVLIFIEMLTEFVKSRYCDPDQPHLGSVMTLQQRSVPVDSEHRIHRSARLGK